MVRFCGLPLLFIIYQFSIIHEAIPASTTCEEKFVDLQLAHSRLQVEYFRFRQETSSCPGIKRNPSDIIIINESTLKNVKPEINKEINANMEKLPSSCADVSTKENGVYKLKEVIPGEGPLNVLCVFDTHDGGWMVMQRRINGSVNFNRSWQHYKNGFGDVNGEHWMGLERIHKITIKEPQELLIILNDFENGTRWAKYDSFIVGDETEKYAINSLGVYSGDAGDSFANHLSDKFTTYDMDHDTWKERNCAEAYKGGWWFSRCLRTNLNGPPIIGEFDKIQCCRGIHWLGFRGNQYSLKSTIMMLRPKSYVVPI